MWIAFSIAWFLSAAYFIIYVSLLVGYFVQFIMAVLSFIFVV